MSSGKTILLWTFLITFVGGQALAQSNDIAQRLKVAFEGSGEAKLAAEELARQDFTPLSARLQRRANLDRPDQAEIVALQGSVAFLSGHLTEAVGYFKRAAGFGLLNDADAFTMAMALVKLGDNHQASGLLSTLSAKHPEQSIYVYWLGRLDYDLRRYSAAVTKFQRALEIDRKSSRAWDSLGLAFDMQGQMEPAHEAFSKAATLNRELQHPSPWPPNNLGYWFLRMDRLKEAEESLAESLRYDPKFAQAHYHLARAFEKDERFEQAIVEYKAAIARDDSSADACYSLAILYRKLHREAESAEMFREYKQRRSH